MKKWRSTLANTTYNGLQLLVFFAAVFVALLIFYFIIGYIAAYTALAIVLDKKGMAASSEAVLSTLKAPYVFKEITAFAFYATTVHAGFALVLGWKHFANLFSCSSKLRTTDAPNPR